MCSSLRKPSFVRRFPKTHNTLHIGFRWIRAVLAVPVMLLFAAQSFGDCFCGLCCYCSPIIIDVGGNGFTLTSAANGVVFDISGTGHPVQISWTGLGVQNAFLALDRNHNGIIDNGKELFGNFTDQPQSEQPNGFLALAVFDKPENGGNNDGVIDANDQIYSSLLLWIDANHDGVCQPEELHSLASMGVYSISLDYEYSGRVDQYGNRFRYRSDVNVEPGQHANSPVGRITYDVALTSNPPPAPSH
jgi:hypothetical protein